MKEIRINIIICLIVVAGIMASCQPFPVETRDDSLLTSTSPPSLPESATMTRPDKTATVTPIPTVEMTPTMPPPATKVSTGGVHVISDPEGAFASVANIDHSGQTPLTWTILPGTYSVTLTLPGYQDWTTPITVTAGSQITVTAILRQHHTIVPIDVLSGPLWDVQWSADGQSLIYALSDTQWPYEVRLLPAYQSWWQYDVDSGSEQALPSPQTRVTDAVRQSLGICPFSSPEFASYPCLTTLQETPNSNRIVYSSIESGIIDANTWLANIDGSYSIYLESILSQPEDVMWSSNGQWLLIGHYAGVDGSKLYYLVSSDGAFVEDLEELTSTSHYRVQGPKPAFSPDGQKLAFVGRETEEERLPVEQLDLEEAYNIYVLDLNTLELEIVSSRFGPLQWSRDGSGLYVLDGAANTAGHLINYILDVQYADFYYIDLTQESYPEQKLADDVPVHLPYISAWAYSPEAQAMAGIFDSDGPIFGILFLGN